MLLSLAFIDYRLFLIQAIKKGAAVINREYPLMLRIIAALLSVCILLVLTGCGQKAKVEVSKSGKTENERPNYNFTVSRQMVTSFVYNLSLT